MVKADPSKKKKKKDVGREQRVICFFNNLLQGRSIVRVESVKGGQWKNTAKNGNEVTSTTLQQGLLLFHSTLSHRKEK